MVDMYVGRDLLVSSIQNKIKGSSNSWAAGASATVGYGASLTVNAGLGYKGTTENNDLITKQTSILGNSGVNIYTENNTHIAGAVIAAVNNNLVLNTGSLSFENMVGSNTTTSVSLGLTAGHKFGVDAIEIPSWVTLPKKEEEKPKADGDGNNNTGNTTKKPEDPDAYIPPQWMAELLDKQKEYKQDWKETKEDIKIAPGELGFGYHQTDQTALATVGQGTIIVRNNPTMNLSGLNRDPSKTMTTEELYNIDQKINPFGIIDEALGLPSMAKTGLEIFDNPAKYLAGKWNGMVTDFGKLFNQNKKEKKSGE